LSCLQARLGRLFAPEGAERRVRRKVELGTL